jgi:ribonucleotide reductase alpha subunit
MKLNKFFLFCFVLSCWNFPNQIVSCNAIDIFENLTMSKDTLTWIEFFWNYYAKVIDYWTIFLVNINKIINK